ncbi:hypothetical protein [Nostoc sp. UHCC 0251]|uniref:hypothetical protein n=1 Tax=Nostoc sp. UHCC 0251 TaxID=3110240 RepID=UPI002B20063C|nr:hypothetical protein [Nostoc sp. UHCC 0251]MEA5625657.1 hypothetical protein [Nostoc sp. UHCC 0251]
MQTNILFSKLTTCEEANLSGGHYAYKKEYEKKEEKKYEKKYEKKHGKKYEKDDDKKDYGYGKYYIDIAKYLDWALKH